MTKAMTLMAGLCIVVVTGLAFAGGYENAVPPEILRRYEPSIVKNERPIVVRITQAMIFGLRDKPDQSGDVYTFHLDPSEISSVQTEIVRKWVRDGHDVLFWGCADAARYSVLFSDAIQYDSNKWPGTLEPSLSKHAVNTDVRNLDFTFYGAGAPFLPVLSKYPANTEVIASHNKGVIAGRIPYGRGNIYVALFADNWNKGTDKNRWTLNFRQWMLGYRVPGAAETSLGSDARASGKPAQAQDRILLKNGDIVSGRLLVENFTVKTSYANLSFDIKQVETVILEGGGQNIEVLVLRTGDRLSGVVGPNRIKVKLTGGQETDIEKDKVKEIVLQQ